MSTVSIQSAAAQEILAREIRRKGYSALSEPEDTIETVQTVINREAEEKPEKLCQEFEEEFRKAIKLYEEDDIDIEILDRAKDINSHTLEVKGGYHVCQDRDRFICSHEILNIFLRNLAREHIPFPEPQ